MKKLFYFLLTGISALNLVSCLPEGSNRQDITSLAVVSYNIKEGLPSMLTVINGAGYEFIASGLPSSLDKGNCILVRFTLDLDNQPESAPPFHATNISCDTIGQREAKEQSDFDETETIADLLPIRGFEAFFYDPILDGKFFLQFVHSAPAQQSIKYSAFVKPNIEDPTEPVDVYLIAQKNNTLDADDTNIAKFYVIDMHDIIWKLGDDATKGQPSAEYSVKVLKIQIKYCTDLDEDDVPVYKLYQYDGSNSTIALSVYK